MIWKLVTIAERRFRTLKGFWRLQAVHAGDEFVDVVKVVKNNLEPLKRKTG
jgi:hypothetical protein